MQSVIYIIICSVAVLPTNAVQHIYMNLTGRTLNVLCEEAVLDHDDRSPLNITNLDKVIISNCKPMPFYRLIPSNIREIDLELNAMPSDPPLTEAHFVNLTVRTLTITGQQRLEPSPNFLNPLTTMTKILVSNMVLPPLPVTSRLVQLTLINGRSGAIGGCSELRKLQMRQWTVEISRGWLANCKHLSEILMERVGAETIYRVVRGATSIQTLLITDSTLVTLSADLLEGATRLSYLSIIGSGLRSINESAFEDQSTSLKYVLLPNNELRGETSARALLCLSGLKWLWLSNNPLSDFCEHFNTFDDWFRPHNLDLEQANITRLCFSSWSSLKALQLERNNITELTLTELPMLRNQIDMMIVNLLNNPLRAPPDNRAFYDALTEKFNDMEIRRQVVTVEINLSLDCDCQHGWLAKALRKLPRLKIEGLRCGDNLLIDEPPEFLECEKFTCEPCVCRRDWRNRTTEADCRNRSLHHVPRIHSASALLASDNAIAAINAEDFPVLLQLVDLSHNKLRRADAEAAHALLAEGARRVRLAGNPLDCDCENGPLIDALQKNAMKVEDYNRLKCAANGTALTQVSVLELCGAAPREWMLVLVAVASLGVMAALVATFTALYLRHSRVVRVFLNARGLLCCGDDDEADTDFRYDAFVSFAHEDADFAEQLVAGLESESNGWRTCVHYRDWVPGELISTQISLSVEQSRRTIVLLSRNFLASKWGMLEFRTANATALHDGRLRLVLVVLDDVLDARLGTEVRGYVRTNTYVRWDDPWFWDKLLYVMPPRRAPAPQTPSCANCRGHPEFIPLGDIGPSPATEHS